MIPALVLAHGTLRGATFPERVHAAARAGFDGIGLAARAYGRLREDGWSDARLRTVLDDAGVRLVESEGLLGFSSTGEVLAGPLEGRRYADPAAEQQVFAMADAFGLRHVNVNAAFEGRLEDRAVSAFAALCDRAAAHDLLVALEPMPCSTVPDVRSAARLVREAGRDNGGICIDSWHHFRGDADDDQLRGVPSERVVVVQLDDGRSTPSHPDYLVETLHGRLLPGEGDFDLARFLRLLDAAGVDAPVSVEVLSDDLDALPPDEAASRAAVASRSVLAAARHDQPEP